MVEALVAADDGSVLRLSPDGELEVFSTALPHYPNGCAVTADGRWPFHLALIDSGLRSLPLRYPARWAADR